MKKLLCAVTILSSNLTYPMFEGLFGTTTKQRPSVHTQQQNRELSTTTAQPPVPANQQPERGSVSLTANPVVNIYNTQGMQTNVDVVVQNQQTTMSLIKNEVHAQFEKASEQLTALTEWIKTNKIKVILTSLTSGYALLALYLMRIYARMHDQTLWSRWRYEDSYEQLMSIPQKELARDLVFAIQQRYTTSAQFNDFIRPLVQFMRDIEKEKKMLKRYIETTKWIGRVRLQRIFPINDTKIELAKTLLQRLLFLEHIFISWAAEFKIQQNTGNAG